jgi:hypothetical protein
MMKFLIQIVLLIGVLLPLPAWPIITDLDRAEYRYKNILADANPGFESGKSGWTASGGTFTTVTSGSNVLFGKGSATWDSNAASQTFSSSTKTIPNGLLGRNCEAAIVTQVPSGTATHKVQAIVGTDTYSQDIVSTTGPYRNVITFPCPATATTARIRELSVAANEPLIVNDDGYIGEATNIGATQIATAWASYTPVYTGFGTVAVSEVEWRRIGDSIQVRGYFIAGTPTAVSARLGLPLGFTLDVTSPAQTSQSRRLGSATSAASTSTTIASSGAGPFAITNDNTQTGSVAFSISTKTTANHYELANGSGIAGTGYSMSFEFTAKIAGWAPQNVLMPDQQGNSWSGLHASDCSWARTGTTFGDPAADATCTFIERQNFNFGAVTSYLSGGNKLPGIVFTPRFSGRYFVCANASSAGAATQYATAEHRLIDSNGVTISAMARQMSSAANEAAPMMLCGLTNLSSGAPATIKLEVAANSGAVTVAASNGNVVAVEWTIFPIDVPVKAVLANSVSSNVVGGARLVWATVAASCTSSPCTLQDSSGDISSIVRSGTGSYTVNFAAGTWSTAPTCVYRCHNGSNVFFGDGAAAVETTSILGIACFNSNGGGTLADAGLRVQCMGRR